MIWGGGRGRGGRGRGEGEGREERERQREGREGGNSVGGEQIQRNMYTYIV